MEVQTESWHAVWVPCSVPGCNTEPYRVRIDCVADILVRQEQIGKGNEFQKLENYWESALCYCL